MKKLLLLIVTLIWALSSVTTPIQLATAQSNSARELAGLWEAKRRFGPDIRGPLLIRQTGGVWWAEIAGHAAQAKLAGDAITFELPDGQNTFRGKFEARRARIVGHWIQEPGQDGGTPYASPVILTKDARDVWRGEVSPYDHAMTFYLMVKVREDGSVGAFLKNYERNIGWTQRYRVDNIEREGETVKLLAANNGTEKGRVLAEGRYDAERETLSIFITWGGTFDFRRVADNESSDFYPRGRPNATYRYAPPVALDDGWPTASPEDVGMSRAGVEKFIQTIIETPIDSVRAHEVHGVLIARHGKLVLEEYFHGANRDRPHDTRSAAKSLTATLIGAAIHSGVPLKASSPVYQVMNEGAFPSDLDPRKKVLTLEHLMTMSSGLDCDDSDSNSPGAENNVIDSQEIKDYYKFILSLKQIREPGEKAVYCSINPHLAGGVLSRAAKQTLPVLMQTLLAEPLQIKRYYMPLTPTGDAYMGGSVRLLPRDFLKLGQLHVNGGTWNGRRILSQEWVTRSTMPLYEIKGSKPLAPYTFLRYGYLWWVIDYPYKGRTVRAFFASGNGGQTVMGIPDLDLVVALYAGNYADAPGKEIVQGYVPKYILPAIDE